MEEHNIAKGREHLSIGWISALCIPVVAAQKHLSDYWNICMKGWSLLGCHNTRFIIMVY